MRIRTVKPEFWTSEQVVECDPIARLLFIGMWNFCDDYGIIPARPKTLKMKVLPGDGFTDDQIKSWIDQLIAVGLMVQYEYDGQPYWRITGWSKHQKIDQPKGEYPNEEGVVGETVRRRGGISATFAERSPNVREGKEGKGRERKGEEGSGKDANTHAQISDSEKKIENSLPLVELSDSGTGYAEEMPPRCAAPPTDSVDWMSVATEMTKYFTETPEGIQEWEYMQNAVLAKADPALVCTDWAGKHQDKPYTLTRWRDSTGKLTTWIRTQALSDKRQQFTNKKQQNNGHIITHQNLATAVSIALAAD